jgi:uncharacterized surface protein with fasciclin (FAS1) repeats
MDKLLTVVDLSTNRFLTDIDCTTDDFGILCEAVKAAGLSDSLSERTFTVFAPNNQAFAELLTLLDLTSLDDIPLEILTEVLHAVPDKVLDSTDVADRCGKLLTMANEKRTRNVC